MVNLRMQTRTAFANYLILVSVILTASSFLLEIIKSGRSDKTWREALAGHPNLKSYEEMEQEFNTDREYNYISGFQIASASFLGITLLLALVYLSGRERWEPSLHRRNRQWAKQIYRSNTSTGLILLVLTSFVVSVVFFFVGFDDLLGLLEKDYVALQSAFVKMYNDDTASALPERKKRGEARVTQRRTMEMKLIAASTVFVGWAVSVHLLLYKFH